jgi:hypothetical protein
MSSNLFLTLPSEGRELPTQSAAEFQDGQNTSKTNLQALCCQRDRTQVSCKHFNALAC